MQKVSLILHVEHSDQFMLYSLCVLSDIRTSESYKVCGVCSYDIMIR